MPSEQILSEEPVTMSELKKRLESNQKRDTDLNFRANKTLEYLQQTVSSKNAPTLFKKLMELNIPRLKDVHVAKIVDVMPGSVEELKMVLSGYIVTVNQENQKKILGVVDEYR